MTIKSIEDIKDEEILSLINLNPSLTRDKTFQGSLRKDGKIFLYFENSSVPLYGFLEKKVLSFSDLNEDQISYLKEKGYSI
jgi:hypothetical protein